MQRNRIIVTLSLVFSSHFYAGHTKYLLSLIKNYVVMSDQQYQTIEDNAYRLPPQECLLPFATDINQQPPLLFTYFPALTESIAHITLANLPTPVQRLTTLEQQIPVQSLWIKRDDLSAPDTHSTGGNKIRKLEFLLADALDKTDTVLTFGCVGSNHALATACYAQHLDLDALLMLKPQPNSQVVRKNLRAMYCHKALMYWSKTIAERNQDTIQLILDTMRRKKTIPYVIPTGGSCPLGIIGFVNAAFELKEQIKNGLLPEPDYIYVPIGSKGTAVGLLLGIQAAGLKSKIVAIATENEGTPGFFAEKIQRLFEATNQLLHNADPSFALHEYNPDNIEITFQSAGKAYGLFTPEGKQAAQLIAQNEHIILDGTYTAKALAGLLHHVQTHNLSGANILYWHTYDAQEESYKTIADYTQLPEAFHYYFQTAVQELDA